MVDVTHKMELVAKLRDKRMFSHVGHGGYISTAIPDPDCEEAADALERLQAEVERLTAGLRDAASNLTEASRAVERAANADPKTVARLALHIEKMAIAARALLPAPKGDTT